MLSPSSMEHNICACQAALPCICIIHARVHACTTQSVSSNHCKRVCLGTPQHPGSPNAASLYLNMSCHMFVWWRRLDLIRLTAHSLSASQRTTVISMLLQALVISHPEDPVAVSSLPDCASLAALLSLLHYLLLQASQPPPAGLLRSVDTLLKVRNHM